MRDLDESLKGMRQPPQEHWYASIWSRELKAGRSVQTFLFGQAIVLFRREDGQVAALRDQCPHRLVPLSAGRCESGGLRCGYHGWKFDGSGQLIDIPSLPEDQPLKDIRIASYPCVEQDGLIWIYPVADAKPTSRPYKIPGLDGAGFNYFTMETSFEGEMIFALENFLDATHTHYIHAGLIRSDKKRKSVEVHVHRQENEVEATYQGEELGRGLISRLLTFGNKEIIGIGRLINPTIAQLEYTTDKGYKMYITVPFSPTRAGMIQGKVFVSYRPALPGWLVKALVYPMFKLALRQDLAIVRLQAASLKCSEPSAVQVTSLDIMFPHIVDLWRRKESRPIDTKKTVRMDL